MHHQRHRRHQQNGNAAGCLRPLIRIFGVMTAFVICGVGVDVHLHGYRAGVYIIFSSLLVLFLEAKWIVTLFLVMLLSGSSRQGSACLSCWSYVQSAGNWRLAPPYVALGVALILWPNNLWLSHAAGFMLVALALMRLCALLRFANSNGKDEGLLPHCEFEKVEAYYSDIADDCFVEIEPNVDDDAALRDLEAHDTLS